MSKKLIKLLAVVLTVALGTIGCTKSNKIDDNNYTLEVNNSVKSINILAVAEDEKSKINGIGVHELNVGENEFNKEK